MTVLADADAPESRASRLDRLLTQERLINYPKICLAIFAIVFTVWVGLTATNPNLVDPMGKPLGYDFISTWSAGRLAVEGRAGDAYEVNSILAVHREAAPGAGTIYPWPYPPPTQMLAIPFGMMPYPLALLAFMTIGLALWAHVIFRLIADKRALWAAFALPAGLICFMFSQNGFISAGLMGSALLMLDRRPWLAGVLIGLLAFKPHLGLLIPIALLATGRWKTIIAAGAVVSTLVGASILTFGHELWIAFFHNLSDTRTYVDSGFLPRGMIPTIYAFALSLGLSSHIAMALQFVSGSAAAASVWLVWRSKHASFAVQAATLCTGAVMVSPYMFHYDLVMLGLAIGFLAMEGLRAGFQPFERPVLIIAWCAPLFLMPLYGALHVQIGAALAIGMMAILLRRGLSLGYAPDKPHAHV